MEKNKKGVVSDESLDKVAGGAVANDWKNNYNFQTCTCDYCGAIIQESVHSYASGHTLIDPGDPKNELGVFSTHAGGHHICKDCLNKWFDGNKQDALDWLATYA